jgi:DNA-binding transcriptional LysR family regulator
MTLSKTLEKTSLGDVLVFAAQAATGNQRDAAKLLGWSQPTFNRRLQEARETFYRKWFDPDATGETVPKLHR